MTQPNAAPGSPLKAAIVRVTPFEQNCTLIWDEASKVGAVVDPGGDLERIEQAIKQTGISIEKILLTHGHIDHAGGADELREKLGVKIEGPHKNDVILLDNLEKQGKVYGVDGVRNVTPDRWLEDRDTVTVGELTLDVRHCPGHTPGHVVFHHPESKLAIVGDVLFKGSIGRWDFPLGNHQQLVESITKRLWPMGDDTAFVPGHGPMSTFGHERATNPLVGDAVLTA